MTPKPVQFCNDISTKSSYPQNNDISKNPKNIEIQDFEPPKMVQAYVYI